MGKEIDVLKRALERERKGKAAAERVIEQRIRELYLNTLSLESKIKNQEQSMSIIFDNMLDAVFFFDRSGKILEANKAAYHLVGKDFDRQNLKYVTDFSEKIAVRIQKLLDTAISKKTVSDFNFPLPLKMVSRKSSMYAQASSGIMKTKLLVFKLSLLTLPLKRS